MRGRQQFNKQFDLENHKTEKASKSRGRDKHRHDRRNECLCDRYYFYAKIQRLRYEDVQQMIQLEFFIAPITIAEIIEAQNTQLTKLKKEQTTAKQLSEKWPHLNWKVDGRELLN